MNTTTSPQLASAAARLRVATLTCAVLFVLVAVWAAVAPAGTPGEGLAVLLRTSDLPRLWAAGMALAVMSAIAAGLFSISRMLACIAHGETFSARSVVHFRRFALCLLVAALLKAVLPIVAGLWLAFRSHAGVATLSLSAGDGLTILLACVFYFVSRLFVEASRLDEDNRSIV